jgi:hypothetical protein
LIFFDLNLSGERVAAKVVASLEEALDGVSGGGSGGRLVGGLVGGLDRGAGGVEGIAAKVVASLEEALDGVSGGGSGGRHFYFLINACEAPVFMVFPAPGSNDNHHLAFLKKKESFLKFFYFKGFLHHAAPAAPIVNSVAGRAVPRLHLLVVLLHGHAPAVLLLHVLAALEVRAECHLPLLRNGVAACHLVVVRAAAHLLLVLVTTHASAVDFGCWRG